jgi:cyclase
MTFSYTAGTVANQVAHRSAVSLARQAGSDLTTPLTKSERIGDHATRLKPEECMKRTICLGLLLGAGGLSLSATSVPQPAPGPISVTAIQKVRDNLYWIAGGDPTARQRDPGAPAMAGGNVGVFVTDSGVVVVDTMLAGMGRKMLDHIRSVTDKPVTMIINTHTHFDHSGSNIEFPATVEFVAHENTRAYMAKATCSRITNCDSFKGDNAKFLPKKTFKDKLSLFGGKDQIDLYHFGAGHTGGDTFVVFPAVRAMHTGDIFGLKWVPYIDVDNGGSGVEYPRTLEKAVAGIRNVDTVITGHATSLLKWTDFGEFAGFVNDFVTTVERGVRAGKNVDEITAGYKLPDKYKHYDPSERRLKDEIQNTYDEIIKRR